MGDALAGDDIARASLAAQPSRSVESCTAIAGLERHGLTGIQPDTDSERERGVARDLIFQNQLKLHRGAQRLTSRREYR